MHRSKTEVALQQDRVWDIIAVGGGATGLGIAVDAASRGYSVLLLEKHDFAKGTSSRSTKLVHGGVRYLAQGNVKLVKEALRERGLLLKNAPHLTRRQPFVVPAYSWWDRFFYGTGLRTYDLLAGRLGLGSTDFMDREELLLRMPLAERKGLRGGIVYFDGQFDDARLAVNLAQTAVEHGATLANYMSVESLARENGKVRGVIARDMLSGREYPLRARAVVNATGVFVDDLVRMDDPASPRMVAPSQGVHIVLDRSFYPSDYALMIPKTSDKRVLFAVPWHDRVVVGTTDTPVDEVKAEPLPFREEVSFIIYHFNKYLSMQVKESDIKSIFTGLRPLVRAAGAASTALLSRDHTIVVSPSGLVTITGGKWTTYRKMARDAVDNAVFVGGLSPRPCVTEELRIHGWTAHVDPRDPLHTYGSDAEGIRSLMREEPASAESLHPDFPFTMAEVAWACRHEMACRVEDVLARRLRMLFLDAKAAMESAPAVAAWMARELGHDDAWAASEVEDFRSVAEGYLP
jgi:glycerol-3-phosphate dehydrogenase